MERTVFLLSRYLANEATAEEIREMLVLLRKSDHSEELLHQAWDRFPGAASEARRAWMWKNVEAATLPAVRVRPLWRWGWAAAILFLLATGAAYFWMQDNLQPPPLSDNRQQPADIEPGREGAILALGDGRQLVLDSLGNGIVAVQSGAQIMLREGQLVYSAAERSPEEVVYNTMITPRGRQFKMVLPDGTRVWLNAASTLRYPAVFSEKERRIELRGEAYFEVAKDESKPFFVSIPNQAEVEALGTAFNVNAYENESTVNTTLLEGSVRVKSREGVKPAILKPGQQARVADAGDPSGRPEAITVVANTDMEKIMAWKNGVFNFEDAGLQEVMKQLERWYDLEVVYEKGIPDIKFGGGMSRNVKLSSLLKALGESKVHFRLEENRRLVVLP